MKEQIEKALVRKSRALLRKEQKRRYLLGRRREKFQLRTGVTPKVTPFKSPSIWGIHPHFDPRYCLAHSSYLARVIWSRIQDGKYRPIPAVRTEIPKPSGGTREIMTFSIPDAAVSNAFYQRLRDKNSQLFSPFSYAYFKDRGLFDAIIQLKSFMDDGQCYLVEVDFSKYFDSIRHRYLSQLLDEGYFNISRAERTVIEAFLSHSISRSKGYDLATCERRTIGVPQGSSISLFLANLAGHELDRTLENMNGRFVRFADDVVAVTRSYSDAIAIVNEFHGYSRMSGVRVNDEKSRGITLLAPTFRTGKREFFVDFDDGGSMECSAEFDYLGHKLTRERVLLSSRSISRAKARVAKIVYLNLLYSLRYGLNASRISGPGFDWDLINCINEIRRYIYGPIREDELTGFIEAATKIGRFRGFMGFCPLVNSVQQFRELDGWMIDITRRALKERYRRIAALGKVSTMRDAPTKKQLIDGTWFSDTTFPMLEPQMPSFVRGWRAARKKYKLSGLDAFENPNYYPSSSSGLSGFFY